MWRQPVHRIQEENRKDANKKGWKEQFALLELHLYVYTTADFIKGAVDVCLLG